MRDLFDQGSASQAGERQTDIEQLIEEITMTEEHPIFAYKMTTAEAESFAAKEPTLIGHVAGFDFYECPIEGDMQALYAHHRTWGTGLSHWHDLPDEEEIEDALDTFEAA